MPKSPDLHAENYFLKFHACTYLAFTVIVTGLGLIDPYPRGPRPEAVSLYGKVEPQWLQESMVAEAED